VCYIESVLSHDSCQQYRRRYSKRYIFVH
jgi:hypothetical protein